jgi:hypothetical protein
MLLYPFENIEDLLEVDRLQAKIFQDVTAQVGYQQYIHGVRWVADSAA